MKPNPQTIGWVTEVEEKLGYLIEQLIFFFSGIYPRFKHLRGGKANSFL
jgi:hypothetical protein